MSTRRKNRPELFLLMNLCAQSCYTEQDWFYKWDVCWVKLWNSYGIRPVSQKWNLFCWIMYSLTENDVSCTWLLCLINIPALPIYQNSSYAWLQGCTITSQRVSSHCPITCMLGEVISLKLTIGVYGVCVWMAACLVHLWVALWLETCPGCTPPLLRRILMTFYIAHSTLINGFNGTLTHPQSCTNSW